ncbi:glycosyltransferase family 2 protein, partial [Campylobacter coli]|nr:glycosyltransferase family 2 protein [Campylobacter coli]
MKIGIFPITTYSQLDDFIPRVVWYLYPFRDWFSICNLYVSFKVKKKNKCLEHFDQIIYRNFKHMNISYVSNSNIFDFSFLFGLDYIFLTNDLMFRELSIFKKKYNLSIEIIRIDHERLSYADSFFLRFGEKIPNLYEKYKQISKNKILSLIKPLKTNKIYLFGTGPNSKYAFDYDYSDGLVIACNSMVINKDIIVKLKPKIFVIADPIFHAGPSSYAAEFRQNLIEMFIVNPCVIVVPLRDYHIYSTYLPSFMIDFLVPIFFKIPSIDESPFYIDILKYFEVKTTNNILTLFQLPLAASLGNEIYIIGCDGRPKSKDSYFWSHNDKVQIINKMDVIKVVHKGFFQIKYNEYYDKHMYFIKNLVKTIEKHGKQIINLTPSYIPPLQKRISDLILETNRQKNICDLSIILPIYNMQKYIEKYLNFLLNMQDINYELIVIDDFSEDLSLELLLKQELQNVDRLKVYQNFNKNGLYGAIKTGLKLAVGKYVLILDSDIVIYPDKLKSNLKLLKHNEEKKILFTSSDFATKTEIIYQNYNYIHSYASFIFKREFINRYMQSCNISFKEEILLKFPSLIIKNQNSIIKHILYSDQFL